MARWSGVRLALIGGLVIACNRPDPAEHSSSSGLTLDEVVAIVQRRDYFALRDRLATASDDESDVALVAQALTRHAFSDLVGSNAAIASVVRRPSLTDSLRFQLRAVEATNLLRLSRYAEGLAVVDSALVSPPAVVPATEVDDLRNLRKILAPLRDVPAQQIARRDSTTIDFVTGLVPVTIGDSSRLYAFDTGANISIMTRSQARSLGLTILPAGIDVGSSTDVRNPADLAVAPRVTIGGIEVRNVVFLVFDDALLTFPNFKLLGAIGFPVIDQLGEIRLTGKGRLTIPATVPDRLTHNLALDGHTPLTRITWNGHTSICRLDTGASATDVYEPFYRRHRTIIDSIGTPDSTQTGGVGGIRTFPVRVLKAFQVAVGDTTYTYPRVEIMTQSIAKTEADNFLFCNLGHDLLDSFREYIINFRSMSFVLR